MLDNFGMGEFLMLALFALLFFGPERLPEIGARIGRWLSQLTQASKVFMTQWTEEASAIQDAVREVKGIRDEIRAAQAEISGSLDVARQDISETIVEARNTVQEATVSPEEVLEASAAAAGVSGGGGAALRGAEPDTSVPPRLATPEETEEVSRLPSMGSSRNVDKALSKTQDILDELVAKRGLPPFPADEPGDNGAEPAEEGASEAAAGEGDAQASRETTAPETEEPEAETAQVAVPPVQAQAPTMSSEQEEKPERSQPAAPADQAEQDQKSAYEKTQQISDELAGAAALDAEPAEELESAIERSSPSVASTGREPAAPQQGTTTSPTRQLAAAAQPGVSFSEFTQLSAQVSHLERELRMLQQELRSLHIQTRGASVPAQETLAEDDSKAVSMEEAV